MTATSPDETIDFEERDGIVTVLDVGQIGHLPLMENVAEGKAAQQEGRPGEGCPEEMSSTQSSPSLSRVVERKL